MYPFKDAPARPVKRAVQATLGLLLLALMSTTLTRAQDAPAPSNRQEPPTMTELLKMSGKVIAQSNAAAPAGKLKVRNYRVEELTLPRAVEAEVGGKRVEVTRAFRLTVTGGPFPVRALPPVIWVDDVAVGYGVESEDLDAITAVTFDESLLRDGATVYLSYGDKENRQDRTALPEKLQLGAEKGVNQ